MARNGASDPIIVSWANLVAGHGPMVQRIARLLAAVQDLPYQNDPEGTDFYQGVVYTLGHDGDCEKFVCLFASGCLVLGVHPYMEIIAQPWATQDHMTAGAIVDGVEYWAETTVPGAYLGEYPFKAVERLGYGHRLRGDAVSTQTNRAQPTGALTDRNAPSPWQKIKSPQNTWVQWVQLGAAQGWLDLAFSRFERESEIEPMRWLDQQAAVKDAWAALSNLYRALDLPATIDPLYLGWLDEWWGRLKEYPPPQCLTMHVNPEVATGNRIPATIAGRPDGTWRPGDPVPTPSYAAMKDRLIGQLGLIGQNKNEWEIRLRTLYTRAALDDRSMLRFIEGNPMHGDSAGCANLNAQQTGCPNYTWRSWSWDRVAPGFERIANETSWSGCPPLLWVYEAGRNLTRQIKQRGIVQMIDEARNYQIALNVQALIDTAHIDGTEHQISDLIEQTGTITLLAATPANRSAINRASAAIALIASTAAVANPLVGGALGILSEVAHVLPPAQGWDIGSSTLGRCVPRVGPNDGGVAQYNQPYYTAGWIAGTPALPPNYDVPQPPSLRTEPITWTPTLPLPPPAPVARTPDIYRTNLRLQSGYDVRQVPRTQDLAHLSPHLQQAIAQQAQAQQTASAASKFPVVPVVATVGVAAVLTALGIALS